MKRSAAEILVAAALAWAIVSAFAPARAASSLSELAFDASAFEDVIASSKPDFQPPDGVTGISVPHHLVAADLIARGFWAASANTYDRVILLSPDHFRAVDGPFATSSTPIGTAFGDVETDAPAVERLLAAPDLFETVDLSGEHGVHAVAPFIRRFFPGAKVVPVLASVTASPGDWQRAASALGALVTERTLVVQSTDYSHYRPVGEAILRDQESLGVIAAMDAAAVAPLVQPTHMDSKASQFIQMSLQAMQPGVRPVVVANRNSLEYGGSDRSTTSYIVTVYVREPADGAVLGYDDQTVVFFGGDVLLGRFLAPVLADARAVEHIAGIIGNVTGGAPVIANLEGVVLDEPVIGAQQGAHLMQLDMAAPVLKALNVVAGGVANNHAHDFGALGVAQTQAHLRTLGIQPLVHGEVVDLGAFRIVALGLVAGRETLGRPPGVPDVDFVCDLAARPPLVAFVHWGEEYTSVPGEREREVAEQLARCGVSLIVGAHSHQASPTIELIAGGATQSVYSLGNLLFDQSLPESSGALLEVRFFRQGTLSARLVPIPNLFLEGRRAIESSVQGRGLK